MKHNDTHLISGTRALGVCRVGLSGCATVRPDYKRSQTATPTNWTSELQRGLAGTVNETNLLALLVMRKESRCSHYRLVCPELDEQNWRAWIIIYKGRDGTMQLEKQPSAPGRPGKPPETGSVVNRNFFGRFTFA